MIAGFLNVLVVEPMSVNIFLARSNIFFELVFVGSFLYVSFDCFENVFKSA